MNKENPARKFYFHITGLGLLLHYATKFTHQFIKENASGSNPDTGVYPRG